MILFSNVRAKPALSLTNSPLLLGLKVMISPFTALTNASNIVCESATIFCKTVRVPYPVIFGSNSSLGDIDPYPFVCPMIPLWSFLKLNFTVPSPNYSLLMISFSGTFYLYMIALLPSFGSKKVANELLLIIVSK